MNQKHLLGIGDIREECANALCAKPTDIAKDATYAKQSNGLGGAKQSVLVIKPFNMVYVFIRDPYGTKQGANTYALIICDDIQWENEETRKGSGKQDCGYDNRTSNVDSLRNIINLYQNGENNHHEENNGEPFYPFALRTLINSFHTAVFFELLKMMLQRYNHSLKVLISFADNIASLFGGHITHLRFIAHKSVIFYNLLTFKRV